MKLIIAIIRDIDLDGVSQTLTAANFRITQVASTGGFLRHGLTTMLIGVEAQNVPQALQIIRENLKPVREPNEKRATIIVLPVEETISI